MIQLADLFHEHRLAEITLFFVLYVPIGLCLVLIRSLALALLFLLSCILPSNPSVNQFLIEAVTFVLALTCVDETKHNERDANRQTAKVIVSNRVSSLDAIVLQRMIANHKCKLVHLYEEKSGMKWLKLNTLDSCRTQEELLDSCANQIQQSDYQLVFSPECETTTGTDGLLKFNLLPFTLAQKLRLSILPVCLRTSRAFHVRTTVFNSHPLADLFWFLFSPYTRFQVDCLPMVASTESSADEVLAEQVRETMSRALHVEATPFDDLDVAGLKKQPELLQQRHEQRRAEFQQMIHVVHQQVPLASLEAIRYDLETTKDVQRTIANLNERVAAATRAANKATATASASSQATGKSSGGSNHRAAYERSKQELIEKNRQLFLNKYAR